MNLVPENINEAIKHLPGRSEEEILGNDDDIKKLSDDKLIQMWMHLGGIDDFTTLDAKIYNELKRRNSTAYKSILGSLWFVKNAHKLNGLGESIKHLPGRSEEEIEKADAQIIDSLKEMSNDELYRLWVECPYGEHNNVSIVDNAILKELKDRKAEKQMNCIKDSGWYKTLKDKIKEKLDESIKHLPGRSFEEITDSFKKMTDRELYLAWLHLPYSTKLTALDVFLVKELKKRGSIELDIILSTDWYIRNKDELFVKLNESIKHLSGRSIGEIIEQVKDLDAYHKVRYILDMERTYPNIFKDFKESDELDDESNQLLFLMKIKASLKNKSPDTDNILSEFAEKYGRKNLLDKAEDLFSKSELSQLKLSLFKKTQTPGEQEREENFDTYAFIGYEEEIPVKACKDYYRKELGIENLIKIDKYNHASLAQISMMKIRAQVQYGGSHGGGNVWCVYVPKDWLGEESYMKRDIPKHVLKWIDEHKFKV